MKRDFFQKCISEAGLVVTDNQVEALVVFAGELKKWNKKINLTAIINDEEIAIKHFVDALFLADFLGPCQRLLDIGSGAGIPAIPLKVMRPELSVVSVDAVAKKIHFQRHVARLLKLENFEALHSRVEELRPSHGRNFDVITSRAFSSLGLFVKVAAPLLHENGCMIAMKGPYVDNGAERESEELLAGLGFEIMRVHPYALPFNSGKRSLVVITPCKPA